MTNRERVKAILNGEKADRLPMVEWASWWDQTTNRWVEQGAPHISGPDTLQNYFGLDALRQSWIGPKGPGCPGPSRHGGEIMIDEADYEALKTYLYSDASLEGAYQQALAWKEGHEKGEYALLEHDGDCGLFFK